MNKAIICIDDESAVLLSLKDQLQKEFGDVYDIEIAESGQDALEIIEEIKEEGISLELIISDYLMPGMNGDEFLIKAKMLCPNSKKLLLTGQANLDGVSRIINEVGLYRYINKPWDKEDLIVTVKEALKSFETEKELNFYTQHLEEKVKEEHAQNKTYLEIIDQYLIASKTDIDGVITDVSHAMCELTGYSREELIGSKHNIIRHPDMPDSMFKSLWDTITSGKVWEKEIKNKKKNGDFYWVKSRISPTFDNSGNIVGYASIRVDITDKKKVEELSVTDELTKLYNRRYFNYVAPKEIKRAIRENKTLGFAIFDVDNFKLYNDNYGHRQGDIVLEEISKIVRDTLKRPTDYGFRLGGEEFGILVFDTSLDNFNTLTNTIKEKIYDHNIEHLYNNSFNRITASFGAVTTQCTDNLSIKEIYQIADELLYYSKENGRNKLTSRSLDSLNLDTELRSPAEIKKLLHKPEQCDPKDIFSKLLKESAEMIFILQIEENNDGSFVYANESALLTTGYTLDELKSLHIDAIRKPMDQYNTFKNHMEEAKKVKLLNDYAFLICKNKKEIPIETKVKIIQHNGITYNIASIRELTSRFNHIKELEYKVTHNSEQLEESLQKLTSYANAMDQNSLVSISDSNGIIKYVNSKFCEVSGYDKYELLGSPHNIIRHPDTSKELFKNMWETIQSKKIWKGVLKNRKKTGESYIVQSVIVPVLDSNDNIKEYIATRYEITEIYKQKKQLEQQIQTDHLTSLANRYKLNQTLDSLDNGSIALIDINGFHQINDFYGEKTGDRVIKDFAQMIVAKTKDQQLETFHLHADQFVLLNTIKTKDEFTEYMRELNLYLMEQTIAFDDKKFDISTTATLSFESPENLLSTVSLAHSYAKENHLKFAVYSFENSPESQYANNIEWTSKIKKAIKEDRFTVYFQPIVDTYTTKKIKYEALVRMIDEDGSIISPYYFLDISKKANYYTTITKIVIEKSMEFFTSNDKEISINLTIEDIKNEKVKTYIFNKLKNCKRCQMITFEIVESEGIENFKDVDDFIKKVKLFGCKIAIDDFGTGYSNFEYLLHIQADFIKIDGSLIKDIDKNRSKYNIVKTITNFAKEEKIQLIAEFVSSKEIYEKIQELEIEYCQGYYFGEPQSLKI